MRPLLAIVFFSFAVHTSHAQVSLARYFDYELFPEVDFATYKEIPVTWNFDGKTQREFNSGLTALKEERFIQAIASLDEAIKLSPDLWIGYYYRAICLKTTGKLDDALRDLQIARTKSGGRFQISYEIGEVYQHQQQFTKALKHYEEARELAPDSVEGYYGIANIAFLNLEPEKAVRFYKKCMDANPSFPDAYLKAGLLKLFVNRRENKAFEYLDKAIEVAPTYQEGLFWRGLINIEFNNPEKALADWNRLIQLNPQRPIYTLVRGYLHIELNDFEKAFIDLKNAVIAMEIDENAFELGSKKQTNKRIDLQASSHYLMRNIFGLSDEAAAPLRKAYCLIIKEKYQDALTHLNQSLEEQQSAAAYLLKACTFEYLEKHDSSLVCLNKTLALDNDIFEAHKKRAIYRTSLRDWRGATSDFMAMEKLQPESIITYKLRGQLKASLNDHYGCIIDLTRYLKSDSVNVEMIKLRAHSQYEVANYKGYKEDYTKLVKLDTFKLEHHQGLYIANILLKDTVAALDVLTNCEKALPGNAFSILQQMEIYLWKKDWGKALFFYSLYTDKVYFKNAQQRSEALYLKGLAHLGRNEPDLASQAFEQSINEGKLANFVNLDAHYERGKLFLKAGKKKQTRSDFKILRANNYPKDKELVETVLNSD
ncbi:MAG TPA: tetratricopeptide repeat protein [Chryseosolibacter sp.]